MSGDIAGGGARRRASREWNDQMAGPRRCPFKIGDAVNVRRSTAQPTSSNGVELTIAGETREYTFVLGEGEGQKDSMYSVHVEVDGGPEYISPGLYTARLTVPGADLSKLRCEIRREGGGNPSVIGLWCVDTPRIWPVRVQDIASMSCMYMYVCIHIYVHGLVCIHLCFYHYSSK